MSLRNPTLVLSLLLLTAPAHAFVWALLGRGALARGTLGAVERSAVAEAAAGSRMRMGQVGRLNSTDLSWLGREIGKKAIEEAIREN